MRTSGIVTFVVATLLVAWSLADDPWLGGGPGFGATQAAILGVGLFLIASWLWASPPRHQAILTLVISTLLCASFAELILRHFLGPQFLSINQFDPGTIYRLVPGAERAHTREAIHGGERIHYRINSAGYRGRELETGSRFRIAVFGDSFIQADYSNDEETFVVQLESWLRDAGSDVEVVNAGVAGFGPDQELLALEAALPRLHPDLVVVAIFTGNDFGDLVRNKLFRLDESGNLRKNHFSISPDLMREMTVQRHEAILKTLARAAYRTARAKLGNSGSISDTLSQMGPEERLEYFQDLHKQGFEEYMVRGDNVVHDLGLDTYDADVSLTPQSASALFKIAMMRKVIERMVGATRAAGVPIVLVPIPHPVDVGGHPSVVIRADRYSEYQPRRLVGIIEEIASMQGVPCVDLYSEFAARGSSGLYFGGYDDHWNSVGQALGARLVGEFLRAHHLVSVGSDGNGAH